MKVQTKAEPNAGEQSIEELQRRYEKLNTKKIQAETNLENTQKQLESLKKEAREKYGTDDVTQLREKLVAMQADNDARRKKYQTELDKIEEDLAAVETKFAAAENESALEETS